MRKGIRKKVRVDRMDNKENEAVGEDENEKMNERGNKGTRREG